MTLAAMALALLAVLRLALAFLSRRRRQPPGSGLVRVRTAVVKGRP
jgi:hypothetical protein